MSPSAVKQLMGGLLRFSSVFLYSVAQLVIPATASNPHTAAVALALRVTRFLRSVVVPIDVRRISPRRSRRSCHRPMTGPRRSRRLRNCGPRSCRSRRSRRGPSHRCRGPSRRFPSHDRQSCYSRRRSEEHTSELQSRENLVCRLLLEKKKKKKIQSVLSQKKKPKKTK